MDLNQIQPKTTVAVIISRLQGDDEYIVITKHRISQILLILFRNKK
jgi:hypothetical protein